MNPQHIVSAIVKVLQEGAVGDENGDAPNARVRTQLKEGDDGSFSLDCHLANADGWSLNEDFFDLFDCAEDPCLFYRKSDSLITVTGDIDGKTFWINLHND